MSKKKQTKHNITDQYPKISMQSLKMHQKRTIVYIFSMIFLLSIIISPMASRHKYSPSNDARSAPNVLTTENTLPPDQMKSIEQEHSFSNENPKASKITDTIIHWDLANSPYLIDSVYNIDASSTLQIDPGVLVEFGSDGGIYCQGTILANGTDADPIIFTRQNGHLNWSGGITISDSPAPSIFTHCIFEYGYGERYNGIVEVRNSRVFFDYNMFRFNSAYYGMITSYQNGSTVISHNVFYENDNTQRYDDSRDGLGVIDFGWGFGGTIDYSESVIKQNVFYNNTAFAIDVYTSNPLRGISIVNNIIAENLGDIKAYIADEFSDRFLLDYNNFYNNSLSYYSLKENDSELAPDFINAAMENFHLVPGSPLMTLGLDNEAIGLDGNYNFAPQALLPNNQHTMYLGETYQMPAGDSWDPDTLDWNAWWEQEIGPSLIISNPNQLDTMVQPQIEGDHTLKLTLTDGNKTTLAYYDLLVIPFPDEIQVNLTLAGNSLRHSRQVDLSWNALPMIANFHVYCSSSFISDTSATDVVHLGDTSALSFSDFNLHNGYTYYAVQGYNTTFVSDLSNNVQVQIEITTDAALVDQTIPSSSECGFRTHGNIYWTYPSQLNESTETFNVFLGTNPNALPFMDEVTYSNLFSDDGIINGDYYSRYYLDSPLDYDTTYYWKVERTNSLTQTTIASPTWSFHTEQIPTEKTVSANLLGSLPYTDASGLAYDGNKYWFSFKSQSSIYSLSQANLDAYNFNLVNEIDCSELFTYEDDAVSDLAFNDGYLYCSVFAYSNHPYQQIDLSSETFTDLSSMYCPEALAVSDYGYLGGSAYTGRITLNGGSEGSEIYDFGWQRNVNGMAVDPNGFVWMAVEQDLYKTNLYYNASTDRFVIQLLEKYSISNLYQFSDASYVEVDDFTFISEHEILILAHNSDGTSYLAQIDITSSSISLDAPTMLTQSFTTANHNVQIQWTSVNGATSYGVYLDDQDVRITADTSYNFQFDQEGWYSVYVTALTDNGESAASDTITIIVDFDYQNSDSSNNDDSADDSDSDNPFDDMLNIIPGYSWLGIPSLLGLILIRRKAGISKPQ